MCRVAFHVLVAVLLAALACSGDEPDTRSDQTQTAGANAPPPSAAGASAGVQAPDLGLRDPQDPPIVLPDEDAGSLTLPGGEAKKPPADPNITFDWTETQPRATRCEAGEYVGTFSCVFTLQDELAMLFGFMVPLEGEVRLTLARSMNGEFLEIADGRFDALASSIIGASATLRGKLDCSSNQFLATLENGLWAIGDPAMPFLPGGMLRGNITGTYRDAMLAGEWTLGDPMLGDCVGTWMVRRTP